MKSNRSSRIVAIARYVLVLPACATVTVLMMWLSVAHGQQGGVYKDEKAIPGYTAPPKTINMGQNKETCWKGTGTNAPTIAGCHQERLSDGRTGRTFTETCEGNILIDHTPGHDKGSCPAGYHAHGNDTGHPSRIDCNAFCRGIGKAGGRCDGTVPAQKPCTGVSAVCRCN